MRLSVIVAGLIAGIAVGPVSGISLRNVLSGYALTSWGEPDGLPPGAVWAIARDVKGYLWLGTDSGLLRFDGLNFVRWETQTKTPLEDVAVRSLLLDRDGDLWVGFGGLGGVSRIRKGDVLSFGVSDGLGPGDVTVLLQDSHGQVWAGTRSGLFVLDAGRWVAAGAGLPATALYSGTVGRDGQLFLATAAGAFRGASAGPPFTLGEGFQRVVRHLAWDSAGTAWVSDPVVAFRRLNERRPPTGSVEKGEGSRLLFDSRGNLWVGTLGQGLWRIASPLGHAPTIDRVFTLTGLSADGVTSLVEDSDGSIWVGTNDGLNRLSPHKVTPVVNLGPIHGIEGTPDGSLWVGAVDGLIQFPPGHLRPLRRDAPFDGGPPSAMHSDRFGRLWVATAGGLLRFANGVPTRVGLGGARTLLRISSITSDQRGGLWLYDGEQGMFHWTDGELAPLALPESLRLVTVISSLVDHLNRLWLSFENGAVIVVADGHPIETLTERGQVEPTVFRALFEDQKGAIWLGGNRGLARVSAGGVLSVPTASALPTDSVIGIVEDQMGDLWLALEGAGVARINRQEVALALSSPEHPVQFSYYDKSDGFAGAPRWFGDSSAARSNDGRLWFISRRGVTMIDPNQLPATRDVRPVVEIERVIADAVHMLPASSVSLPAGTARVEIDYTIPILSTPFRVRFRYRLDGFDDDWVEAGTRRQAVYTNLPPRDYVFRVMTNDGNGTWTDAEATMSFSILPRFYQESWFAVGCVSLLSLLAWGSWRLRLRRVRTQFALLFSERARLAREIHDTLLQGLFGIGLQCETIASELVPPDHELRGRLLSLQQEAEEYVREARSSIRDLRSPKLQSGDLVSALRTAGARLTAGTTLQYVFSVDGEPYRFSPTAEEQLLRVGEEALRNVVRHASAREVQVMLRYWRTSVTLRIVDDGCGFDYRRDSLRSDHCGLESMRERTHAVRGEFRVSSEIRRGTKIEVTVPRAQGQ